MESCIALWLQEYRKKSYVRFAIVDKTKNTAIGTIEIFGGEYGVLRIDICPAYEKSDYIDALIRLSVEHFL